MPDPQRDLAAIIEPPPPAQAPAGPDLSMPLALGVIAALLRAVVYGYWRRQAPRRALRRLARSADPVLGARELARLLPRLPVQPDPDWLARLEALRFGRPSPDAAAILARLCAEAETRWQSR